MASGKRFRAKFFDKTGVYISELPVKMKGFRKIINGGLGDLNLTLPLKFEEAYQNAALTIFNRVEVYVGDFLLYSGFIAGLMPYIRGSASSVSVRCRGHASRFSSLPLKNGNTVRLYTDSSTGLKTSASASAATLDKVFKAIIDRYQAEAVYPIINYTTGSIVAISNSWTYTLQTKSLQYSIEKLMENAPYDWYWRVGADNIARFMQRSSTPDFSLNFKTQISFLGDEELIDGMINRSYFAYNGSPATSAKVTSDIPSSDEYGDWWDFKVDGRYTNILEVQNVSQALIDAKKLPPRRTTIEVADSAYSRDSGYDIEHIEPGQVMNITNLPEATASVLPNIFTVMAVQYAEDMKYATLELENPMDDIARELARREAREQAIESEDTPSSYS